MQNFFFFTGENFSALNEKLQYWKREFVKKYGETNLDVFDMQENHDRSKILTAIESEPFLSEKRMIIIKNMPSRQESSFQMFSEEDFKNIPASTIVIVVIEKPDRRTKLVQYLEKTATVEKFELLKGRDLEDYIVERLKLCDKSITSKALQLFLFYTGEDTNRITQEIEKLSLLNEPVLHETAIENTVTPTPEAQMFKALDAIGKIPSQDLLKIFHKLARRAQDLTMIFYMMVRQFRLLIQVRFLLDQKTPRNLIQKRLKLAPFQAALLSEQARHFSLDILKRLYQQLAMIDYQFKTGKIPYTQGQDELFQLKIDQFLCSISPKQQAE